MEEDIKQKLWNIDKVVDDIKLQPQTYETILKQCKTDGTCQIILRRKLNRLCKDGIICKSLIPGTRFGKCLFYVNNKKYYILVESTRIGSVVYYFFDWQRAGNFYIKVTEIWRLNGTEWVEDEEKTFFEGNTLKFI
jgi:hypothetical protein